MFPQAPVIATLSGGRRSPRLVERARVARMEAWRSMATMYTRKNRRVAHVREGSRLERRTDGARRIGVGEEAEALPAFVPTLMLIGCRFPVSGVCGRSISGTTVQTQIGNGYCNTCFFLHKRNFMQLVGDFWTVKSGHQKGLNSTYSQQTFLVSKTSQNRIGGSCSSFFI